MKKLFLICVLAAGMAGYAQAQTTAGNMMLGGTFMYRSEKQETPAEDAKRNTFTFAPQFGYFVADNLAVGLGLDLTTVKIDQPDGDEDKSTEFLFEPFARYYMFTSNDKFAFYAEGALGFGSTKVEPDGDDEQKSSMFRFRVSPGFSYFFNEKWALDFQLSGISYTSENPNTDSDADDDKINTFEFGVSSLSPQLGFRYFIGN
ncbi:outer membrane beta-barrel protein [Fulvivirgaceae bacterium PWU5]|uniref:Outer membrane beta-barrel protein n=1 Tax=Dawidia cretensis TaxID=2782350 RepID=A0AAP2DY31_9BACT|nr:outer membrane beta-barrel protein [Dawidia cretensis]MBT1708519.1 outer membrane beta-barrel protein [Dawidia cretensis]